MVTWRSRIPGVVRFEHWRLTKAARRRAQGKLAEIKQAYQADFDAAGNDEGAYQSVVSAYLDECREYDAQLDALEWNALVRVANRFGLDAPGVHRAKPQYRQLRKQIAEARWAFWERVAKLVLPIISLIVAIIALFLSSRRH